MLKPIYHTFLVTADAGSFSKAAGKLYISSVAVMNQMNQLEKDIGTTLFHRTHHGVTLTKSGQLLHEKIVLMQKEAMTALAEVRAIGGLEKIPIRVGASMMRPATFLMNLCQKSEEIQRRFSLQIVPFNDNDFSGKWLHSVIGDVFDCVTSPYDVTQWNENFNVLRLGEEAFQLAVPNTHPLSRNSRLTLADLNGCTIVTPSRQSTTVDQLCAALERSNLGIRINDLPGFYTANTFFEHPNDILLTRESFDVISSGFKTIEVEWEFSSPTGIIYPQTPATNVEEFFALLKKASLRE
jgi:DNA-binding transcriptional LysR family regulator